MIFMGGEGESVTNFAARSFALALAIMAALVSALSTAGQSRDLQKVFAAGQAELQRGNLDAAEHDFKEVLTADPKAGPAYTNLGVIAMRRKKWDEALEFLKKAARLQPNEPGIRLNIGLVEYKRGNYPDAIGPLESVLKEQPDSVQARYLLGLSYSFVERHAEAVTA